MSDWNDCMKAKISSDEAYRERVLSGMHCMRRYLHTQTHSESTIILTSTLAGREAAPAMTCGS